MPDTRLSQRLKRSSQRVHDAPSGALGASALSDPLQGSEVTGFAGQGVSVQFNLTRKTTLSQKRKPKRPSKPSFGSPSGKKKPLRSSYKPSSKRGLGLPKRGRGLASRNKSAPTDPSHLNLRTDVDKTVTDGVRDSLANKNGATFENPGEGNAGATFLLQSSKENLVIKGMPQLDSDKEIAANEIVRGMGGRAPETKQLSDKTFDTLKAAKGPMSFDLPHSYEGDYKVLSVEPVDTELDGGGPAVVAARLDSDSEPTDDLFEQYAPAGTWKPRTAPGQVVHPGDKLGDIIVNPYASPLLDSAVAMPTVEAVSLSKVFRDPALRKQFAEKTELERRLKEIGGMAVRDVLTRTGDRLLDGANLGNMMVPTSRNKKGATSLDAKSDMIAIDNAPHADLRTLRAQADMPSVGALSDLGALAAKVYANLDEATVQEAGLKDLPLPVLLDSTPEEMKGWLLAGMEAAKGGIADMKTLSDTTKGTQTDAGKAMLQSVNANIRAAKELLKKEQAT